MSNKDKFSATSYIYEEFTIEKMEKILLDLEKAESKNPQFKVYPLNHAMHEQLRKAFEDEFKGKDTGEK